MKILVKVFLGALLCMTMAFAACNSETSSGEHVHTYGDWEVYKHATCEGEGGRIRTCTECGTSQTEKIEKLGHSYE